MGQCQGEPPRNQIGCSSLSSSCSSQSDKKKKLQAVEEGQEGAPCSEGFPGCWFIKGFIFRNYARCPENEYFLDYIRFSFLMTLKRNLPKNVLDKSWPVPPPSLRELEQKVVASEIFKDKKDNYPQSVPRLFLNTRLGGSPLEFPMTKQLLPLFDSLLQSWLDVSPGSLFGGLGLLGRNPLSLPKTWVHPKSPLLISTLPSKGHGWGLDSTTSRALPPFVGDLHKRSLLPFSWLHLLALLLGTQTPKASEMLLQPISPSREPVEPLFLLGEKCCVWPGM